MVALVGDAELDEGNIYECLQEGWKNDLRNVWWIVDYNRQSLDGIVHEGLFQRIEKSFDAFSWPLRNPAVTRSAIGSTGVPTPTTPPLPFRAVQSGASA